MSCKPDRERVELALLRRVAGQLEHLQPVGRARAVGAGRGRASGRSPPPAMPRRSAAYSIVCAATVLPDCRACRSTGPLRRGLPAVPASDRSAPAAARRSGVYPRYGPRWEPTIRLAVGTIAAELLDRELLGVVAHHTHPSARGRWSSHSWCCKPGGPVQRDVAVLLFQRRDPALKLLLARGADGEADLRVEHRRVPAGL